MENGNLTHTFKTIYSVNKLQLFGKDYIITESDEYYSIYTSDFKLVFDKVFNYKITNDNFISYLLTNQINIMPMIIILMLFLKVNLIKWSINL